MSDTDVFGQTEYFQYDTQGLGNLVKFTDRQSNVTTYAYEPMFNQIATIMAPGMEETQYLSFDNGNPMTIIDANGDETTKTYYSNGQVETVTSLRGNEQGAIASDFTTNLCLQRCRPGPAREHGPAVRDYVHLR